MASACSLATAVCAQEAATTTRTWSLGMGVSPGIAYRDLVSTEGDGSWDNHIAFRNSFEESRFAYGGNLMCALDLSNRFSV
jgi:hypothetical protein